MPDPNEKEKEALLHGGRMGGEYLSSIECYDLSKLQVEQWDTFVQCVVFGFCEKLAAIEASNMTPPVPAKKW